MAKPDADVGTALKPAEFAKIRQLAYDTFGLDLRAGKETLVSARLSKHIRKAGCGSFEEYYWHVLEDRSGLALTELIDALTTNHTSFFREPAHFDFFRQTFLPGRKDGASFRIWSAACSSGEEPYSIAMCVYDQFGAGAGGRATILATDISSRVLAAAERGIYPAERLNGIPPGDLHRYWLRGDRDWVGSYRAKKDLRALIEFRRLNLMEPISHLGQFALIFCRNVMIYFDKSTQRQLVERLTGCLEPGGYLLTGHAESLSGIEHGLRYIAPAIFQKTPSAGGEARR